jgi:hypothetical protein
MYEKQNAIKDLIKADKKIKKNHRYNCGLLESTEGIGIGDFFFESPDGQNGELYYKLKELGWRHSMYKAEYYWRVSKNGLFLTYCEGDISIKPINNA